MPTHCLISFRRYKNYKVNAGEGCVLLTGLGRRRLLPCLRREKGTECDGPENLVIEGHIHYGQLWSVCVMMEYSRTAVPCVPFSQINSLAA